MPPRTRGGAASNVRGLSCCVTGGSGFVGQRLGELLVERGAARVVSFDRAPTPKDALSDERVVYQQGDLCKMEDVEKAVEARWGGLLCCVACHSRFPPPLASSTDALRRARTACGTLPHWWGPTSKERPTTP